MREGCVLSTEPLGLTRIKLMAIVTINIKKECIEQMEMDILGSCVYDCRVFISSMVDSLPKPQFQRQLATSFQMMINAVGQGV